MSKNSIEFGIVAAKVSPNYEFSSWRTVKSLPERDQMGESIYNPDPLYPLGPRFGFLASFRGSDSHAIAEDFLNQCDFKKVRISPDGREIYHSRKLWNKTVIEYSTQETLPRISDRTGDEWRSQLILSPFHQLRYGQIVEKLSSMLPNVEISGLDETVHVINNFRNAIMGIEQTGDYLKQQQLKQYVSYGGLRTVGNGVSREENGRLVINYQIDPKMSGGSLEH